MADKFVFKGRLIKLSEKIIRLPNGYTAKFEVIEHLGAVLIIPFLAKDKVILLRQFRPVIGKYIYELPAGTLKKNETSISCAKREIIEETGYSAVKFTRLGYIYPVPGYSTEKIIIYKAEDLIKQKINTDEDEIIQILIADRVQVKTMFDKRQLVDAKTISAFAFAGWL